MHATVMSEGKTCNNKWVDNHYAVDGMVSGDYIQTYIEETICTVLRRADDSLRRRSCGLGHPAGYVLFVHEPLPGL